MTAEVETLTAEQGSDYAQLLQRIRDAGLLDRRPGYYLVKTVVTLLLFAAGGMAFWRIGASWWNLMTAIFLAIMSGQFGFLGHDAGHRQVARTKKNSTRLSLMFGNLLLGLSIAWWVDKHNQHHAHPNTDGLDPDVAAGPIVFTMEQAAARNSAFGQWLARNQGWMFFVLMPLESLSLHVSSVQYVLGDKIKPKRLRFLERFLLLAHAVLYLVAVFTVLTPIQAVVFTIVHQGLWGSYMTLSFAPNHKGMRILTAGEERDFLRRQVLTSRNVRGGRIVDWVLGGLNYQIEHHLFPSMPRSNLRYAQPIVRAYCHEKGVPYAEEGLLKSYRQARRHLADVGAAAAA